MLIILPVGTIVIGGAVLAALSINTFRKAEAVSKDIQAEKDNQARLDREYQLARHTVFNLNRQLAKAKANKKRQSDIKANLETARETAKRAKYAMLGKECAA